MRIHRTTCRGQPARMLDRIATGLVVVLLGATPLAFGAVHPRAFAAAEAGIFVLTGLLVIRLALARRSLAGTLSPALRSLLIPLTGFLLLIGFQLLPLPPALERILAPGTYRLYAEVLPQWPRSVPYQRLSAPTAPEAGPGQPEMLPSSEAVAGGAAVPFETPKKQRDRDATFAGVAAAQWLYAGRWRPLAVAPLLTARLWLKCIAYAGLFLVILAYPFGRPGDREAERRFCRRIIMAVVLTGLLVASLGIIEVFDWNGKLLWFFVPYDWERPLLAAFPRASGPFVNPDHFANYLDLALPLAGAVAFYPTFVLPRRSDWSLRLVAACAGFVLLAGILLSGSRGGWIGAMVAILVGAALARVQARTIEQSSRWRWGVIAAGVVVAALALLIFVGPAGRTQAQARLDSAVSDNDTAGFAERVALWRPALRMAADFPVFGVGLGNWPELVRRYQQPPWSPVFWRQTHNDYLQLLAETGLLGAACVAWFIAASGLALYRGLPNLRPSAAPLWAGLVGAMAMMLWHELVDFPLHIPANAIAVAVMLGLALRLAWPPDVAAANAVNTGFKFAHPLAAAALVGLIVIALRQEKTPYPYYLRMPLGGPEARALVLAHPANPRVHLALADFLGASASAAVADEVRAALALEPNNPLAHDLNAEILAAGGHRALALEEITRSVFASPWRATHAYLSDQLLPWLSPAEQQAVEKGYRLALAANESDALNGLGAFYAALGRYAEVAALYGAAEDSEHDPPIKARYAYQRGLAYLRLGQRPQAQAAFRDALALDPSDTHRYEGVADQSAQNGCDLSVAQSLAPGLIAHGADAFVIDLALARAKGSCGDTAGALNLVSQALSDRPADYAATYLKGRLYLQRNQPAEAIVWLNKATELLPSSSDAFFLLGRAAEQSFDFALADKSYARAIALDPGNPRFESGYREFRHKLADNNSRPG